MSSPDLDDRGDEWRAQLEALRVMLLGSEHRPRGASGVRHGVAGPGHQAQAIVAALDALHAGLDGEQHRLRGLRQELAATQAALRQVRAELIRSRADAMNARRLAELDVLTELPNRRFFLERLGRALQSACVERASVAVLYLDLDDFKPLNDAHGHAAGDAVLRIIASRLARLVRSEDVMSRIGGDEFACLVQGMGRRRDVDELARKLLDAVSAPLTLGPLVLSVRPSIGVACFPMDGTSAETLLLSADRAMYRAKQHGTGVAFGVPCEADG